MKTSLNIMDNNKPPMLLTVIYKDTKGNTKFRQTNNSDTANDWECKYDGEIYVDTRYKAKLRLYWYLWHKKENQLNKI
jgi:hypothetical protein